MTCHRCKALEDGIRVVLGDAGPTLWGEMERQVGALLVCLPHRFECAITQAFIAGGPGALLIAVTCTCGAEDAA